MIGILDGRTFDSVDITDLPALTGSIKQIAWAERIRDQRLREVVAQLRRGWQMHINGRPMRMVDAARLERGGKAGLFGPAGAAPIMDMAGQDAPANTGEWIDFTLRFFRARFEWVFAETRASVWIDQRERALAHIGPDLSPRFDPLAFFREAIDQDVPPPARRVRLPMATIKGHVLAAGRKTRADVRVGIKDGRIYQAQDGWCRDTPLRVLWDGMILGLPAGRFLPDSGEVERLGIICGEDVS